MTNNEIIFGLDFGYLIYKIDFYIFNYFRVELILISLFDLIFKFEVKFIIFKFKCDFYTEIFYQFIQHKCI